MNSLHMICRLALAAGLFVFAAASLSAEPLAPGVPTGVVLNNGSGPGEVGMVTGEEKLPTGFLTGPGAFQCDPEGNIWVADTLNHRLLRLAPSGGVQKTIDLLEIQKTAGLPEAPTAADLAVAGPSLLYVADLANQTVLAIDPEKGFRRVVGRHGQGRGEFVQLSRVRADASGTLFIEDAATQKALVYNADGTFAGDIPGMTNFVVDAQGRLYQPIYDQADIKTRSIAMFDRSGQSLGEFARITDAEDIQLIHPMGFTANGFLVVTYATEAGRAYVAISPFAKMRDVKRCGHFIVGLEIPTSEFLAPDGRILVLEADAKRLIIKELSF